LTKEQVDKLCGIFERPTSPRKRSPAARLSSMSFFDEVSDKEAASYSAAQLNQILEQRAHVIYSVFFSLVSSTA
jgi:hypothetical protein